jgi:hypothetical protein
LKAKAFGKDDRVFDSDEEEEERFKINMTGQIGIFCMGDPRKIWVLGKIGAMGKRGGGDGRIIISALTRLIHLSFSSIL